MHDRPLTLTCSLADQVLARAKSIGIYNLSLGLVAELARRPEVAKLTLLASTFGCEIWLTRNSRRVNAKSIMGVMMLAAGKGSTVLVEAEGADADAALKALLDLIANKFGEGE